MAQAFDKAWGVVKGEPDYDAIKETLEVQLIDDGTLDTVIDVNGTEYRFSYDYESGEYEDEAYSYDAFVEQCLEDAKEEYIMEMVDSRLGGHYPDEELHQRGERT
jgi:hypothetical protein